MTARDQGELIPDLRSAANGDARGNQPHLILPNLLARATTEYFPSAPEAAAALGIIRKWADLERSGKLAAMNETALQGEFLTEVFGQVLGYKLFSEDLPSWELQHAFGVNGGTADAALGLFAHGKPPRPYALVELKGPLVNIDRDRFNGRTAVQQCWDYLNAVPDCPWGIVCNYVGFRLYHRNKTPRAFEHFTLQDLRREDEFRRFYVLFGRNALLPVSRAQRPLADRLLEKTGEQQRQVGDSLYQHYAQQREELIGVLCRPPHSKPLEAAIRIAQKLIDRIIFVAFCEDRGLVPPNRIEKAWKELPAFTQVTNPRWQNFMALFHLMHIGDREEGIPPFNGGLFRPDPEVDDLNLSDDRTQFFKTIGSYDFRDAVNVDVLGHIFERSINDLERLRRGGLFGQTQPDEGPKMAKSAERKRGGVYYTPPEFTDFIVRSAVGTVIRGRLGAVDKKHAVKRDEAECAPKPEPRLAAYWHDSFETLRDIKVCDPACGSGAFLIRAYEEFEREYQSITGYWAFHDAKAAAPAEEQVPNIILRENLYGADLSPQAVEITQLALWIRSARPDCTLTDLSKNVVCGNSLVADAAVAGERALDWRAVFPDVFSPDRGGFDCIIGNPPWERMKLQNREFFSDCVPDVLTASSPAESRKLIADLERSHPDLYARYLAAKESAEKALSHARASGDFPLTGKGDINSYSLFAELARRLVAPTGRVGILVPLRHCHRPHDARLFRSTGGVEDPGRTL